ncbi:MAG: branched-chain amino acid ABC transporter permease [Anaerosomatales bacterium]|nr:branched-chain amino acid ABC transporter permease [Anaerosomatales bacterium]
MGGTELLQFVLAGLKNGSIYALVALGFTLIYAATGVINFAQGEFYMLGGMLSVWAYADLGLPLPLAGLVGVAATAAVGGVFELGAIRQRKDGDPLALIVITVGGSMVLSSMARHLFGPNERPLPLFSGGGSVSVFGAVLEVQTIWILGLTALAVVGLWYLYNRTGLGRAMRACAVNRDAARIVGIDTRLIVTVSFLLAAALGALAGLAVTPLTQTAFDVGPTVGIKGFAAAILGGLGNPIAAVVGGLVLGMLESVSIAFISSTYKDAIALIVLLAVLFMRPQGILGRSSREKV